MATASALETKRRGFWLKVARERANLTQEAVVASLGLSSRSKSTMSAWESGTREPRLRHLTALARLYDVPVSVFLEPAPTAAEQLEDRLAGLARRAIRQAAEESNGVAAEGHSSDRTHGEQRGKRSA